MPTDSFKDDTDPADASFNPILRQLFLSSYQRYKPGSIRFFLDQLHKNNLVDFTDGLTKRVYKIIDTVELGEKETKERKVKFNEVLECLIRELKTSEAKIEDLINFGYNTMQFFATLKILGVTFYEDKYDRLVDYDKFILENEAHQEELGKDCMNNLLIAESRLIIAYKEISNIYDSLSSKAVIPDPEIRINTIIDKIKTIHANLESAYKDPFGDNIFIHYLKFLYEYTRVKIYDCIAKLAIKNQDQEVKPELESAILSLKDSPEQIVRQAQEMLTAIERICQSKVDREVSGMEFFLGKGLFDSLPNKPKLEDIQAHLLGLAHTYGVSSKDQSTRRFT